MGFIYDGNDPNGFMVKDEIVDYVKRYAASFNPPFKGDVEVHQVYKNRYIQQIIKTQINFLMVQHW